MKEEGKGSRDSPLRPSLSYRIAYREYSCLWLTKSLNCCKKNTMIIMQMRKNYDTRVTVLPRRKLEIRRQNNWGKRAESTTTCGQASDSSDKKENNKMCHGIGCTSSSELWWRNRRRRICETSGLTTDRFWSELNRIQWEVDWNFRRVYCNVRGCTPRRWAK